MPLIRSALPAEFSLVAACCRWPQTPARSEKIREIAGHGVDWDRFLRIVRRQRVEGLVHDGLKSAGIELPDAVARALAAAAASIVQTNLAFVAESVRLQRLLGGAGISVLFVKGVTLAMIAYRSLGVKSSWDIDMAVAPDRVAESCALLQEAGYERLEPGPEVSEDQLKVWIDLSKETIWLHRAKKIAVELHSRFVDNPLLLPKVDAASPRQMVAVSPGVELPTLRKDQLFSYLCVHGATHAWSRLKWIADVGALIGSDDEAEIARLYRASLDEGVGRCSAQALLLCSELLGTRLGPLEAELRRDRATRWLVAVAIRTMAGKHVETELDDSVLGTIPIHLSHFLIGRGLGYKLAEVRRKSLSPHDRAVIALPRPLRFLYPLILLPSWIWRRARKAIA